MAKTVSEETVEFWGSALTEFLREFTVAAETGDVDGAIKAGARIAQLGLSMSVFWKVGSNALIDNKERMDMFNGTARAVALMCQRHIDQLGEKAEDPLTPPDSKPDDEVTASPAPDRNLN